MFFIPLYSAYTFSHTLLNFRNANDQKDGTRTVSQFVASSLSFNDNTSSCTESRRKYIFLFRQFVPFCGKQLQGRLRISCRHGGTCRFKFRLAICKGQPRACFFFHQITPLREKKKEKKTLKIPCPIRWILLRDGFFFSLRYVTRIRGFCIETPWPLANLETKSKQRGMTAVFLRNISARELRLWEFPFPG